MIYIFETDLIENKSLIYSLQSIYGIGKKQSCFVCESLGFSKNFKLKDLNTEQLRKLVKFLESLDVLMISELKKKNQLLLKSLVNLKHYKGIRRIKGLPVRGQRTHTNGKTAKKRKF